MSDRTKQNDYFRSFEHQAGTSSALETVDKEFANYTPEQIASMPRRGFLKLMGASMALAGLSLTGCRRWPKQHLVPSTAGMRGQMPGQAEFYATVFERNGVADALFVKSFDGRPIKIEGNPLHPLFRTAEGNPNSMHADGLGAADAFAQASLLTMYDPYRSRSVIHRTNGNAQASNWDTFFAEFFEKAGALPQGKGMAILTESTSSLTVATLREKLLVKYPQALWATYEPLTAESEAEAGRASFGVPTRAVYHLDKAKVIVSLDCDLLGTHCASTYHGAGWAKGRRSADSTGTMNRMYLAESTMSATGAAADHRLPVRPSRVSAIAIGLAKALGVSGVGDATLEAGEQAFVDSAAADLKAARSGGVVAVGGHVSKEIQALVASINASIGAIGNGVTYHELPDEGKDSGIESFKTLSKSMREGSIHALLITGGNPVYDAPSDLDFSSGLKSVPFSAHLSTYDNETSRACYWHLPRSHYLEHWGDARAYDGTVSIQQPLIEPMFDSKSPIEFLAALGHDELLDGMKLVQRSLGSLTNDDVAWKKALHDGLVPKSGYELASGAPKAVSAVATTASRADSFELRFLPSMTYDGRYADNAWLQEAPDPLTKLVWDNAALINKNDAERIGVKHGEIVKITLGQQSLEIPAFILWGQPRGVIGLPLGYGRSAATPIGNEIGFNTYVLRRSDSLYADTTGATITSTGRTHKLVTTQEHHMVQTGDEPGRKGYERRIEGKDGAQGQIVREASLKDYKANPNVINKGLHSLPLVQLYDTPYKRPKAHENGPEAFNYPHAWGMAIDMSICTGCNACAIACQSENNIPVVGKGMVEMNREMHWLRLDRYFKGDADNPGVVYQPMMCVQCENAPCEQVCPVAATVHDTEGLNTMVYNRCIGTRYCSNNCPYKARRFNYFDWHARDPRAGYGLDLLESIWLGIPDTQQVKGVHELSKLRMNPDVSVRMRGVMEKCTYCTQRIKEATIQRKNEWNRGERENYTVSDGDIVTACQQACATQAIVFGDLNDPNSKVSQLMKQKRTYAVLEDLNTRPRTKYMAKITNPSESITPAKPQAASTEHHG
ncbi:MAG TPA: TAT-variant-translocated molybdopterin oxidoreductase [Tepidisphaeraceae bacterium]|nr:TAT-variant-translocated molybdopterin oxidoreductase [Tepidisphaeraceae bacterium]